MPVTCTRCSRPAAASMTFDYDDRSVWLEELESAPDVGRAYPMCNDHADRLSPPVGWTLTDRRNVTRLFAPSQSSVVA